MSTSQPASSLAEQIRATRNTREPVQTILKTDHRVLARVTDGIYRQPASALRELISNAYDADAKEVTITTDAPRFSVISVRDDGNGLTPEILQYLIEHIGGSAKRTEDGESLHITANGDPSRSPGGRQLIGKMGIGLFSVAQFTRRFLIITKTRGSEFRTVAEISLGAVDQEHKAVAQSESGQTEITTGHARIWVEFATDTENHGTEVKLLDLLPRTRAELASIDLWHRLDFEKESEGRIFTREPIFHIGRMGKDGSDNLVLEPHLPWTVADNPQKRFEKLVTSVRDLAKTDKELVDLESVCDRYLQTIWMLALAAPLKYIESHPFDLRGDDDISFFLLENQTRGQAKTLALKHRDTPRKVVGLTSPSMQEGDRFDVIIDGVKLSRPILFRDQPKTQNAVKTPILCIGKCTEEFKGKPASLSGGRLDFEAYLFWTPKVLPSQHQGVLIRVGNASGAPFDRTFMGYQVSEQTRLRQITAEIFVKDGLEGAINLDRESFNFAHPHYQFLVKWLHSAIRQLTNRHKEIGSNIRAERLKLQGTKAQKRVETIAARALSKVGVEDIPEVVLLDKNDEAEAPTLRKQGITALRKRVVLPESNAERKTSAGQQRAAFSEQKAVAIAQILQGFGLLDELSYEDQETLVRAILDIVEAEADQ